MTTDIDLLYYWAVDLDIGPLWRLRGQTPDPREFGANLWRNVGPHFVAVNTSDRMPVGYVCAYNASPVDQVVYVAVQSRPDRVQSGLAVEGLGLLIDHLFDAWPYRKVYFESPERNVAQFGLGALAHFEVEARLKDYFFSGGRFHDLVVGAVTRQDWDRFRGDQARRRTAPTLEDVLDIDGLCIRIADATGRPREMVTPDADLVTDLGFDSLDIVLAFDVVAGLAGNTDLVHPGRLATVHDVYAWYCQAAAAPRSADR